MTDYATYMQDDFELQDNLMEVSLENPVTDTTVTGVKAKSRGIDYREVILGGLLGLVPTDSVFTLGAKSLGAVIPNCGDVVILDDASRWTVLSSLAFVFQNTPTHYTLVVRKQLDD